MDEAEHGVYDLLVERLLNNDAVDNQVSDLVLAAWADEEALAGIYAAQPSCRMRSAA